MKLAKAKQVGLWVLTGLIAAQFLFAGFLKFVNPEMAEQFRGWGYSDAFRIFIGIVEITGALLLIYPRTAAIGAFGLTVIMIGAIYTLVRSGESFVPPAVTLALLLIVGYARLPRKTNYAI
jgi:putative oxidoreductase